MNELIECLHCHDEFARQAMHKDSHGGTQVCIGCSQKIRAKQRAEIRRHRNETATERTFCQAQERKAKTNKLANEMISNPRKTPILTGLSKVSIARKHLETMHKIEDILMARELGLKLSDFEGI